MMLLEKLEFEDDPELQTVLLRLLGNLAISLNEDRVRNSLLTTVRRVKAVSIEDNSIICVLLNNLNIKNKLADSKNKDLLRLLINLQGGPALGNSPEKVSSTPRSPGHRRTLIMDKENLITPIRGDMGSDQEMNSDDDDDAFKTPRNRPLR